MTYLRTTSLKDITSCDSVLKELLVTNTSTSKILEEVSDQKLKVEVLSQSEDLHKNQVHIIRKSKLFIKSPENALMYCLSDFYLSRDEENEIHQLKTGNEPIGKIFGVHNILKSEIQVKSAYDSLMAFNLKLFDSCLYHKQYTIFVKGRKMGSIIEIFNKESLMRLWH